MGELSLSKNYLQIAVDGPAGAGKSTVAKAVAEKLGIFYLDTGAMYRAVAAKAIELGIAVDDEKMISELAERTELRLEHNAGKRIWCDGVDYTDKIRSPEVSRVVPVIAAYARVRKRLVFLQRREAELGNVIMDGRDIGTYVLPQADLKIFLTASAEERARRRWLELQANGQNMTLPEVLADMQERDQKDMERAESPLTAAADAWVFDTTSLAFPAVVDQIVANVKALSRQERKQ
ncbi:MAG TPA: (d)CMP kinase [Desulfitobacteriaceae bacterium]|nr:(d)CMP kinase [Desulfitobacteriaceae bacterium]